MADEWTVETLRLYVEAQFAADHKLYDERATAQKDAIDKAESATEKRFESVNEFRATLTDQAGRLMPRLEAEARFLSLEAKVAGGRGRLDIAEGHDLGSAKSRATQRLDRSLTVAIGALIASILIGAATIVVAVYLSAR